MRITVPVVMILALIFGSCSRGSGDPAIAPATQPDLSASLSPQLAGARNIRLLWGMWEVEVAADHRSAEVVPLRGVDMHLNALKALEVSPCTSCLKVSNFVVQSPNELWFDLTIKHPFKSTSSKNLSVFDPRAIFISQSDYTFPISERTVALGDQLPRIINLDGYTSLFNPTEFPPSSTTPPEFTYVQGKFSTGGDLNATLNPFLAYARENPRRIFTPGSQETRTVRMHVPDGNFKFGYAIDASWANPGFNVIDPVADFPPEANCLEPYKVTVEIGENIYDKGGSSTWVRAWVFKHPNLGKIDSATIEAPDLFWGEKASYTPSVINAECSQYNFLLVNQMEATSNEYPVLVRLRCTVPDPNLGETDAYQGAFVKVKPRTDPVAKAIAAPLNQNPGQPVFFSDYGSFDPDGDHITNCEWDFNNDGVYEATGPSTSHIWDTPGIYYVQARVTETFGATDTLDDPIKITIAYGATPFNPVDVTPEQLALYYSAEDACVDGTQCYVANYSDSMDVFEVSEPSNPTWQKRIDLPGQARRVVAKDGYAFVADPENDLVVVDTSPLDTASVVATVATAGTPNDIVIGNGYAYVTVMDTGMQIFDISTPESPFSLNFINTPANPIAVAVDGGYAYVATAWGDLQIIDIDPPESAHIVNSVNFLNDYATSVAVSGAYAYVGSYNGAFYILDKSTPESASVLKTIQVDGSISAVAVEGGYAYLSDSHPGFDILDVDPPESTYVVSSVCANDGYVALNDGYAYTGRGAMGVIDIDPPESACFLRTVGFVTPADLTKDGEYLYLSDFGIGLQIIDISQPESPYIAKTVPGVASGYIDVSEGYAYTGIAQCFSITDIDPVEQAHVVKQIFTLGMSFRFSVVNGYAYVINPGSSSLHVYDVDPPESSSEVGSVDLGNIVTIDVAAVPGYVYVSGYEEYNYTYVGSYITILDTSSPESAHIIKSIEVDSPGPITTRNGLVYLAADDGFLQIIDVYPPGSAHIVGSTSIVPGGQRIDVDGDYVYVPTYLCVGIIDIEPSESPELVATVDYRASALVGIDVDGQYAFLCSDIGWDGYLRISKLW